MEEAYELCDNIAIMDHGRVIASGPPRELLKTHFSNSVLSLPESVVPLDLERDETLTLHHQQDRVEIFSDDVNATIHLLMQYEVPLDHLQIRSHTLEDLFLELTGRQLRT